MEISPAQPLFFIQFIYKVRESIDLVLPDPFNGSGLAEVGDADLHRARGFS
jgi:hypothetical protein